ncbi:MAG: hypothetical protein GXP61_09045, partial [Epsilonproteobacteria bacterium]|nr:hypothetical protein [Campylobacterota bacterium]
MKWYHSIITKISLIFFFAIFGIIAILFVLANRQMQKDFENAQRFAGISIRSTYDVKNHKINFKKLKNLGLVVVKNKKIRKRVFSRSFFFKSHQEHKKMMQTMMGFSMRSVIYNKKIYIILRQSKKRAILLSTPFQKEFFSSILIPILSILFIILLYIAIIKNILPLYTLRKKI